MNALISLLAVGLLLLAPAPTSAAPVQDAAAEDAPDSKAEHAAFTEDRRVVREHELAMGGATLRYESEAGTLVLREEDGTPKASVFYVAYRLLGVEDVSQRPLTFCFNGGPGSSSVWLHLGVYGPRRARMDPDGNPLPPPYELVDNEFGLLDLSDMVFIDPVTTGYSRAVPGEDDGQFHGVDEDVESVAEFIRLYTTRKERWSSPKFLSGESYGTTRAAGLAGELQERHGMYLNGIVLVSSILDFATARFDVGNDLPFMLFLPTYTATAWYHGRLDADLQRDLASTLAEVEAFALGPYNLALARGNRLSAEEKARVAAQLARFTGLSEEYVLESNLRIHIHRFCKELLRGERLTVGRLDSRFKARDLDAAGERYEFDPSYAAIQGTYTGCLNAYVREELGFESDLPYEILTGRVHPWNYGRARNRYLNVAETLRGAMSRNTDLQVYVANGYYDLATPYFATQYTFDHLAFDPGYSERVQMGYFESGHMMYIHLPSLEQLKRELVEFYARAR